MIAAQAPCPSLRQIVERVAAVARPMTGRVRVADIIQDVGLHMGLSRADIVGPCRLPGLFRARAAICWLAREATPATLPQIGAIMGGRDHSSIVHACRRAADMRARDPAFRLLTDRLLNHYRSLEGGLG